MQNLVEPREDRLDGRLLDVIADSQCVSILQAIDKESKPVSQIRSECEINLGVVYRKLKMLQKNGLLESYYQIRPDGKKFFLYRSLVKDISASFSNGTLQVTVALREQSPGEAGIQGQQDQT